MTDQKKQPEVKTPSVVLSFKFASEEAQRRATKEGESFTVYLINAGPWEGRHTFEPSRVRVPSTWTDVQTFEPEVAALEVGSLNLEDADAGEFATRAPAEVARPSLCEACLRGVALDVDGANHVVGGALEVKPCAAAFDAMIEGGNVGPAFAEAIAAAQRFANAEQKPFVVYAAKTCYLVRRYTFRMPESLKASHAKLIEPLPSDEDAKPFVVHVTPLDSTTFNASKPRPMLCGEGVKPTRLFAATPTGERVTNCPRCVELSTADAGGSFAYIVEGFPDPKRHELLTVFTGEGLLLECSAACTCGEWNYTAHGEENGFREEFLKECESVHAEHMLAADEDRATYEAPTKKELILQLYEEGTTDVAELVRRVKARPSYVAQVLQQAGHLEGLFDLYATTGREQNVYTRYFRNVLAFRSVEAARESVQKIDRLYNYFERLGDRAGQHQATVLALLGKNRARWSGKVEESEVFSEWLKAH
jgi:hypothetical protein